MSEIAEAREWNLFGDNRRIMCRLLFFGILATTMVCQSVRAQTQDSGEPVFRIGSFDRSPVEFSRKLPEHEVNFIVGRSAPEKDWYAKQLANAGTDGTAKNAKEAAAPRTITFTLDQKPKKEYQLRIGLLIVTGPIPHLQLTINGKRGRFYPHPNLDYSAGEDEDAFYSGYSYSTINFKFPGQFLHRGENHITLQAAVQEVEAAPDAYLTYDAIELERVIADGGQKASQIKIEPTIFYKQTGNAFTEDLDIFVQHSEPATAKDHLDLEIDGRQYRGRFEVGDDFGEERFAFAVAEFLPHSAANVNGRIGGRAFHVETVIDPQKKWTLFMVPHIHLDIGYSDYQAKVASIQARVLDEALGLIARHPEFRFSTDGEWNVEQFFKTRTAAEKQRLIEAMHKGQLNVPANFANLLTGFPTAEVLLRSLYPSANLSREHETPFDYATITDVPSFSWSYASILSSAGLGYLLSGSNNYRAPVLLRGRLNENSPFWWEGPDGKKVLLWYSRHYMQMQVLFGLPPSLSAGKDMLPLFLQQYFRPAYRADAAILFGTQVENTDLFPQQADLVQQWNSRYAYPKLKYAGFHEALSTIADQFGSNIPTIRGDGGPFWEDGIGSDAYFAAMERQNESRGPSAEKLQTLTSIVDSRLAADKSGLDKMWRDMVLMDEHTWDSYDSVSNPTSMESLKQIAVKDQYAVRAQAQSDFLTRNAMATLTDSISVESGSLIVFNTLNWKRSGEVTFDLGKGKEIIDESNGEIVPAEVLSEGTDFQHVRFIAKDVPSVGYKVFGVRTAKHQEPAPVAANTTTLESPYYRVVLDPATGSVRSIYDKQLQKELVNQQSPYRFGQYLYATGGERSPNQLLRYGPVYPKVEVQIHPAGGGHLIGVFQTPYGFVARMESMDTNTPRIHAEIRLFNAEKKIEFLEEVHKEKVFTKEGVYFAFPFAMSQPRFQYEIQTGVVDPSKDMYPGSGKEWFSVQHWVAVQQDGVSAAVMPLDAPLVTLGDINRGAWPLRFDDRPGNIFSYVMNNYWDTNYRAAQGGRFRFRYVVTSGASTDCASLSRMGWEEMTPLESNVVTTQDKAVNLQRPLDAKQYSFLQVDDPNLLLEDWKPAENGDGTIMRFLDIGGTTRQVDVRVPILDLQKAWKTDAVERDKEPVALRESHGVELSVHPHEILTIRISGRDILPTASSND